MHLLTTGLRSATGSNVSRLSSRASTAVIRQKSRDPEITVDIYLRACRKLGVPPAAKLKRHLTRPVLSMRNSSLGQLGAKACAIALVVSTLCVATEVRRTKYFCLQ